MSSSIVLCPQPFIRRPVPILLPKWSLPVPPQLASTLLSLCLTARERDPEWEAFREREINKLEEFEILPLTCFLLFITERLQDRVQNVVSKAYSNIKTEEFAKLLGMTEMQAIEGECHTNDDNFCLLTKLGIIIRRPVLFVLYPKYSQKMCTVIHEL